MTEIIEMIQKEDLERRAPERGRGERGRERWGGGEGREEVIENIRAPRITRTLKIKGTLKKRKHPK